MSTAKQRLYSTKQKLCGLRVEQISEQCVILNLLTVHYCDVAYSVLCLYMLQFIILTLS